MTATRDPVTRRRRLPVLAMRQVLRRGSERPRRVTDAVKEVARPVARQQHVSVLRRTAAKAWDDRVLGLSAEAAFWQLLSLAPLFLGLLGSIGYLSGALGETTVNQIETSLLDASKRAFAPSVVDQIITPTVDEVLRRGRADVVSVGFLIALWAGSSATATFVNTVTIAYGMRDQRGAIHSRLLALCLYLLTVIIGIVLLPVMVLGPGRLVSFFPAGARDDVQTIVQAAYWPIVAVLLLIGLVTFYHLAPPHRLPWHRGFPGAGLAALVFVGGTFGLREYVNFIVDRGLSYGALAAPIGALLFFYVLALAVLLGAELNATIEQTWPTRTLPPDPSQATPEPTLAESTQAEPTQAEPPAAEPNRAKPTRGAVPAQVEPAQVEPPAAEPNRAKPTRGAVPTGSAGPSRTEPPAGAPRADRVDGKATRPAEQPRTVRPAERAPDPD